MHSQVSVNLESSLLLLLVGNGRKNYGSASYLTITTGILDMAIKLWPCENDKGTILVNKAEHGGTTCATNLSWSHNVQNCSNFSGTNDMYIEAFHFLSSLIIGLCIMTYIPYPDIVHLLSLND